MNLEAARRILREADQRVFPFMGAEFEKDTEDYKFKMSLWKKWESYPESFRETALEMTEPNEEPPSYSDMKEALIFLEYNTTTNPKDYIQRFVLEDWEKDYPESLDAYVDWESWANHRCDDQADKDGEEYYLHHPE